MTFLFTDIEGSTQAWENDPTAMAADLEIHDRILGETIESNGGFGFATGGDSFSAAFGSSTEALTAAAEAQRELDSSECGLRVRMGVHSGEAVERDGNHLGPNAPLTQTNPGDFCRAESSVTLVTHDSELYSPSHRPSGVCDTLHSHP